MFSHGDRNMGIYTRFFAFFTLLFILFQGGSAEAGFWNSLLGRGNGSGPRTGDCHSALKNGNESPGGEGRSPGAYSLVAVPNDEPYRIGPVQERRASSDRPFALEAPREFVLNRPTAGESRDGPEEPDVVVEDGDVEVVIDDDGVAGENGVAGGTQERGLRRVETSQMTVGRAASGVLPSSAPLSERPQWLTATQGYSIPPWIPEDIQRAIAELNQVFKIWRDAEVAGSGPVILTQLADQLGQIHRFLAYRIMNLATEIGHSVVLRPPRTDREVSWGLESVLRDRPSISLETGELLDFGYSGAGDYALRAMRRLFRFLAPPVRVSLLDMRDRYGLWRFQRRVYGIPVQVEGRNRRIPALIRGTDFVGTPHGEAFPPDFKIYFRAVDDSEALEVFRALIAGFNQRHGESLLVNASMYEKGRFLAGPIEARKTGAQSLDLGRDPAAQAFLNGGRDPGSGPEPVIYVIEFPGRDGNRSFIAWQFYEAFRGIFESMPVQ